MNLGLVSLLALAGATGCVGLVQLSGVGGNAGAGGGFYRGPECAPYQSDHPSAVVFQDYDHGQLRFRGDRTTEMSPAEGAIFLTCIDETGGNNVESTAALVADHLDFDDRRFDHLRAGTMVIDCAMNDRCSPTGERDILGMMAGYARRVDPAAAAAALAAADPGTSPQLRKAFAAKILWARGVIAQRVAALDARRKQLWVDIPERVWSERAAYFHRYDKLYAALDPLEDLARTGQGDLADAARKIRALRGQYLATCKVEGCLFTPFVLESTRTLVLLAVRQKNTPVALAEADLLSDDRLTSQYFSRAMLSALVPATEREADAWDKYEHATQAGADAASLDAMFGKTPPIQVSRDAPWITWGRRRLPDLTAALPRDGITGAGGTVRGVDRHGAMSTVRFASTAIEYSDDDCHETNKVDGIGSDGKLIYRQVCTNVRTHVEHQKVDPIEVPADEAAVLRTGDVVSAWIDTTSRKGAISLVRRANKIVQVRGHRLRVPEAVRRDR